MFDVFTGGYATAFRFAATTRQLRYSHPATFGKTPDYSVYFVHGVWHEPTSVITIKLKVQVHYGQPEIARTKELAWSIKLGGAIVIRLYSRVISSWRTC
ncbi:hypothetical protein [Pseudomonas chlororaphis]|uniref:hypothetical protein n=1 Tax=Pseudomonas chlororaphis TaxID=587753 RepID=UPI0021C34640|nr:hypothetical protein [Pseudomonas chlororaphis]